MCLVTRLLSQTLVFPLVPLLLIGMLFFQVPSSGNDSVENAKLQNPLFQWTLKEDPTFATQVKALERMLKVRERVVESNAAVSAVPSGECDGGLDSVTNLLKVFSGWMSRLWG